MRKYVMLMVMALMFAGEANAADVPPASVPDAQEDREKKEAAAVDAEESTEESACDAAAEGEGRDCDLMCYGTNETCCCTAGQKCQVYDCFPNKCCLCKTT